ncbi:MAG: DUF933 domain-containing protein, partial [Campylobacterota bacterium]|nr:DUF933 domain-containing protein [Campylobacterota bacterium]
ILKVYDRELPKLKYEAVVFSSSSKPLTNWNDKMVYFTPLIVPRKGTTAPKAAAVIHNDFEKGFIRAEVISYADFIACGGEQGAKEAGKNRLEGKEYIVADGDVMHFRFNV